MIRRPLCGMAADRRNPDGILAGPLLDMEKSGRSQTGTVGNPRGERLWGGSRIPAGRKNIF